MSKQPERISILLPYKITEGKIFVFLQKRDDDAKDNPGNFGGFGGHADEDEDVEETLKREIEEEMSFVPEGYEFFGEFMNGDKVESDFMLKVDDDFENKIKINEGEYGKFFSEEDIEKETKMTDHRKKILKDFFEKIKKDYDFKNHTSIYTKYRRRTAALLPYKIVGNKVLIFLQKRTVDAPLEPDHFGIFGGHLKANEEPEQTLLREIEEELSFIPSGYYFFKTYEFESETKNVFILKVDDRFEMTIKVNEGQYGKFLDKSEIDQEAKITKDNRIILYDLFKKFESN